MIKGFIFDYGGTLDTCGCHWGKVIWHAYEKLQMPVVEEQFREAYVYAERMLGRNPIIKPTDTFHKTLATKLQIQLEYLCDNHILKESKHVVAERKEKILDHIYAQVKTVTAHSREVLNRLHAVYPMVLVSNFYGNVQVVLQEFGFTGLFNDVIESAVVGVRKPDPRIFEMGVKALGMQPEEVVIVGDSFTKDIEPASKIGCKTIWFKGEDWEERCYDESIPYKIITDLDEIDE